MKLDTKRHSDFGESEEKLIDEFGNELAIDNPHLSILSNSVDDYDDQKIENIGEIAQKKKCNKVTNFSGSKGMRIEESKRENEVDSLFIQDNLKQELHTTLKENISDLINTNRADEVVIGDELIGNDLNNIKLSRRSQTFVEFGSDQPSDTSKAELLNFKTK